MSTFSLFLSALKQKGNLAFEYNPFHNYQTSEDLYIASTNVGDVLFPYGKGVDINTGEILTKKGSYWINKFGNQISNRFVVSDCSDNKLYAKAGSLINLDTEQLNFDLNHPVEIEVQPSYDGSVNLILNDDKNIPRLVNSRFSVREKNTYEIVDRIGENDTNIYTSKSFDKDTSLYYQYEKNPEIKFLGLTNGTLPVGQYCFYFTYCDADDNESDFIAETGLIPVFIGDDCSPNSMDGGIKNQNSTKGIKLKLKNIDGSYNYLKVYYLRYFADYQQNRVCELKKIFNKISINSSEITLIINGNEQTEDLDPNILNISRFNPKSVLTQAQCKNILFFGNIVKNVDNYKELTDCALRIIPSIDNSVTLNYVNKDYIDPKNDFGYYNSKNIYNYTGYFNQEYYRFGVVFIYQNGQLSNVYNTLGLSITPELNIVNETGQFFEIINGVYTRKYIPVTDEGWITDSSFYINTEAAPIKNLNARGVCKFDYTTEAKNTILGIKFSVPNEVIQFLKEELGIRGMFFVRQKCQPNIIAQCYLLNIDKELEAPVLKVNENGIDTYMCESFVDQDAEQDRIVLNDYNSRLYKYTETESISKNAYAAICPDFLLNQPYYNQIFNGNKFYLQKVDFGLNLKYNGNRIYNVETSKTEYNNSNELYEVKICSVTENVPTVALEDQIYRLEIGETEEAYRFRYVKIDNGSYNAGEEDFDKINKSSNIIRGKYSPYLAIYSNTELDTTCLYNIYQSKNIYNITQQYLDRMDSRDAYYSISNRYNFEDLVKNNSIYSIVCYRGDCYYNQFTYRLNRNFNDPSLPNNDQIIDRDTWKNNYDASNPEKWKDISRSDINAVQMGSWITLNVKSAMNYALRSTDHSYVSEEALMGSPRNFFPRSRIMWRGENKMPDSYLYNDAYRASLGYKCYFALQDINYIKNTFSNRIQYSAISIQDSFKNNYRYSLSTYFRDYSQEYGSIQKLVGFEGHILVIFEHGIGIAAINERVLAGQGEGGPVFINTQNVLPEELTIITDTYGTQWGDSVVKSEAGYVYGVDTVAKKIWRVKGEQVEILSDFKVNKFLIDNITLGERELYPTIGLRNVKTHYNNNKKDIMFTFYDDIYEDEEKIWNLCYNELLGEFITFYSWIPSFSENIDTQFFTFNRNTSKWLSLLNKSNYYISSNTGILIENPVAVRTYNESDDIYYNYIETTLHYRPVNDYSKGYYSIENIGESIYKKDIYKELITGDIHYELQSDHWGYYKNVKITGNVLRINNVSSIFNRVTPVITLIISAYYYQNPENDSGKTYLSTETIAITLKDIVKNNAITKSDKSGPNLTTDFYLHGNAGIFNVVENLYPTYWYGETHPFEFEFVVNDKIGQQKIFNNLVIISNKAEPESFHFEIEGDNYDFSLDKRNMYFRQEATKQLFQNLGSNIIYNRYYTDVAAITYTQEQYYRSKSYNYEKQYTKFDKVYPKYETGLVQQQKSTIFPLYYERIDTFNEIYHDYQLMHDYDGIYDFQNLSGSEISWNRDLNQFNVITHIKNNPINIVGRLRGNSHYNEGKWNIQIPSIIFTQKNEQWQSKGKGINLCETELCDEDSKLCEGQKLPPIIINTQNLPSDLSTTEVSEDRLPNIYSYYGYNVPGAIELDKWTARKEARIRDKWIKIRVRYSGKNLAVIHSLATLYNISYS